MDSRVLIGDDFMAPVIMPAAWFCILLNCVSDAVAQAVIPYSSTGLTIPVYSLFSIFPFAPHVEPANFFIRFTRCFEFWTVFFSIWARQISLRSRVTPRYVGLGSSGRLFSINFRVGFITEFFLFMDS